MYCDLTKNKNPYMPTKKTLKHLKKNMSLISVYPQKKIEIYEQKLATELNIKKKQIVLTTGTMEAMNLIIDKYKFKNLGILRPTFWGISYISLLNKIKVTEINMKDIFQYNLEEIQNLLSKSDVIYLCNSNNPTIAYIEKEDLKNIIKNNKNKYFIIDETMLKFDLNYDNKSLKSLINDYKNLFLIVSFSKIYGVAGLRLGIILTNVENYKILTKNRGVYLLNSLTGCYIENNNFSDSRLAVSRKKIKNNFNFFESRLSYMYIKSIKNENSGFILLEIQNEKIAKELQKYLFKKGILVKLIGEVPGNYMKNYIRISAFNFCDAIKLVYYINKFQRNVKKL